MNLGPDTGPLGSQARWSLFVRVPTGSEIVSVSVDEARTCRTVVEARLLFVQGTALPAELMDRISRQGLWQAAARLQEARASGDPKPALEAARDLPAPTSLVGLVALDLDAHGRLQA